LALRSIFMAHASIIIFPDDRRSPPRFDTFNLLPGVSFNRRHRADDQFTSNNRDSEGRSGGVENAGRQESAATFRSHLLRASSGAAKRAETFADEYKLVNGVWFPASRLMLRAENGKVVTRVIEFHNPRIRFNDKQAAR
jgi:hypothetical protein